MSKTCYNCGTEQAEADKFCRQCGASMMSGQLQHSGIQAGTTEERVLWEGGDVQLTTHAVLIGMESDSPNVIPLDTIYEVVQQERCLVLRVKDGEDATCFLDDPTHLGRLIQEQMDRPRHAHDRGESGYIPPD